MPTNRQEAQIARVMGVYVYVPGDNHGFSEQSRTVLLLDRSIERIHVDVNDFPHTFRLTVAFENIGNPAHGP
jgi:hypothetical protein